MARPTTKGTHSIYRRGDGRYVMDLRWRCVDTGKPGRMQKVFRRGTTKAAAGEHARLLLNRALSGDDPRSRPGSAAASGRRTLDDALQAHLAWAKTNRPKTLPDRRALANSFAPFSCLKLTDVRPEAVEDYKRRRLADGLTPATVNRGVTLLKLILRQEADAGRLDPAIATAVRSQVKRLTEPKGRVRWLTDDEYRGLLFELPETLRPLMVLLANTGLRLGEAVALTRADVDLDGRVVAVRDSKTGKPRYVPLNATAAAVLAAAAETGPCDDLFPSRRGTRYTVQGASQGFTRAIRRARIANLRGHDLRHHFATRLRRAGQQLDVIADLLGHATLQMAMRYAHLGRPQLHRAVESLETPGSPSPEDDPPSLRLVSG